jgi:hypothetical protein
VLHYFVRRRGSNLINHYATCAAAVAAARFYLRAQYDVRTWVAYSAVPEPTDRCPKCDGTGEIVAEKPHLASET